MCMYIYTHIYIYMYICMYTVYAEHTEKGAYSARGLQGTEGCRLPSSSRRSYVVFRGLAAKA